MASSTNDLVHYTLQSHSLLWLYPKHCHCWYRTLAKVSSWQLLSHLYNSLLLICPFWTFSELTVTSDIIIISFPIHVFTFLYHLYSIIIIITPLHLLPNTQHLSPPSYLPSKSPIFLKFYSLLCPSVELSGWRKAYNGAVWRHLKSMTVANKWGLSSVGSPTVLPQLSHSS